MSISRDLKPIDDSFTLKEQTHRVLRKAILDTEVYSPGVDLRLDERQLAERLGISRTPVREAMARLEHEGLVEIVPRKGVYIRRKSRAEVLEMVVVWAALESMAARLAASNATDARLEALQGFAMKHSSAAGRADLQEYSDANIRFHMTIFALSGCALLKERADGLLTHMQAIRRRAMREGARAQQSVVDHMDIISALKAHDPELSARLVLEHTMRLHDHIAASWTTEQATERTTAASTSRKRAAASILKP